MTCTVVGYMGSEINEEWQTVLDHFPVQTNNNCYAIHLGTVFQKLEEKMVTVIENCRELL